MNKAIIIGCGRIAGAYDSSLSEWVYSHAHAYALHPGFEVVAYIDKDLAKAEALAAKYGSKSCFRSYADAAEKHHPDVVSVCTPDTTHFKITLEVIESSAKPKVIFLEKPACSNAEELKTMIEVARESGIKIIVNHSRRFDTKHQAIRGLYQRGFFGHLTRANMFYYSGWRHNGVHTIDTLNFIFGKRLQIKELLGKRPSRYIDDPTLEFDLAMQDSPARLTISGQDEEHFQLFEFDFLFDRSRLRIEDFGNRIIYEKRIVNAMMENVLVLEPLHLGESTGTPMQNAIENIHSYLTEGSALEGYTIEDIKETMQIIWEGEKWK